MGNKTPFPPHQSADLSERRKNARVDCRLKATRSSRAGYFVEDEILNLSRSGFSLYSSENLNDGDRIELMVTLEEGVHECTIQAEVTHSEFIPEEERSLLDKPYLIRAGLYICFIEPSQKEVLKHFIEGLLNEQGAEMFQKSNYPPRIPRIRVHLDGPDASRQVQYLQGISDRGLFMEVAYPVSLFDCPRVRFVNPLTEEIVDLFGEISKVQVLPNLSLTSENEASLVTPGKRPDDSCRYGISLRFPDLSAEERKRLDNVVAGVKDARRVSPKTTTSEFFYHAL